MGSLMIGEEVELPALEAEENEEVVSEGLKKEASKGNSQLSSGTVVELIRHVLWLKEVPPVAQEMKEDR
jgi:hypothetical protein